MVNAKFSLPVTGGCRCGAIKYRVTQTPAFTFACHCTDCQHLSASAFGLGMAVKEAGFEITHGEPSRWTKTGSSGKPSHQFHCPTCGVWTHTVPESVGGMVVVRPATLDDHAWVRPVAEIYTRSALPWARLAVPLSYEAEFDDPTPIAAVFAASGIAPGG